MTTTTEQEPELAPAEQPDGPTKPAELVKLELAPIEPGEPRMKQLAPFDDFRSKMEALKATASTLSVTDESQTREMKLARATRLSFREIRIAVEHRRKELGEEALRTKQRIDNDAKAMKDFCEAQEMRLLEMEEFSERAQAARLAALKAERTNLIAAYLPEGVTTIPNIEHMTAEVFANTLAGFKAAHEARIAAAEKAEADRIAKEKDEAEERARVIAENIRLKEENAAKESAAMAERVKVESERKLAEEKAAAALAKEREEAAERARIADAKAKAEAARAQKEREVIEAKAKAQREAAEARTREERQAREIAEARLAEQAQQAEIARLAKLEAEEKAALAPDKEKLKAYAASILALVIPKLSTPKAADVFAEIAVQRDKFAAWIKKKAEAL